MTYREGAPIWVKGETGRMAAVVVKDYGTTIQVRFIHGDDMDTVPARRVEDRDRRDTGI